MSESERLSPAIVEFLQSWPLFDNAITSHGFVRYMRDYEIVVIALATRPDGTASYREGRYRFQFTHCVHAFVETTVRDDVWPRSWGDEFTDYDEWERAGEPEGYVWGVNDMAAYPGATYSPDSALAAAWSRRLGQTMHEVRIETNAHNITLVFHGVRLQRIAHGNPVSGELEPIVPVELVPPAP